MYRLQQNRMLIGRKCAGDVVMGPTAAALLRTNKPLCCSTTLAAAAQEMASHGTLSDNVVGIRVRPSTTERKHGRMPLTVLKPHVEGNVVMPIPDADPEVP